MKSILISINPKWCEKIASGEKTIEVRKTRPKLETPFKVYIYCTQKFDRSGDGYFQGKYCGKVIGEFVCDRIEEFTPSESGVQFKRFKALYDTCLSVKEIRAYLNGKVGYGWHISDLVIYAEPRELDIYSKVGITKHCGWGECDLCEYGKFINDDWKCTNQITRPPQSWCYVEEVHI